MKIAIIGAGIAGLTTALVLKQKGINTTIYESASQIKPVGAGIMMANNAMQIFDKLGIRNKIEKAGHRISNVKFTDPQLRIISELNLKKFEKEFGVCNVAIHRADLQKILAEEVGFENIRLSKRLLKIEEANGYLLTFNDGTSEKTDIIIGADGIKSKVRKHLFGAGTIRDSTQRCWRGICECDVDSKYNHQAHEAWDHGKRIGFIKTSDRVMYWFAVINEHLMRDSSDITELFKEFHPDTMQIISRTPKDDIFFSDISDLQPITKWHRGKACLIGDAAHASTPNMGQGACQAVEDAYVLGQLFSKNNKVEEVFATYEKLRMKKAHFIVKTSWMIGKIAHLENRPIVWLRNKLFKLLPRFMTDWQLHKLFTIENQAQKS